MEIKGGSRRRKVHTAFCRWMLLASLFCRAGKSRPVLTVLPYTIRDGQEYISLGDKMKKGELDHFLAQYNLGAIGLQQLDRTGRMDSLTKLGWTLNRTRRGIYIINRPLLSSGNIDNPAGQMIMAEKHPTLPELFPAVNNGIRYGYNRFRHKYPFPVKDGTVAFFLRGFMRARQVNLAGSFNSWSAHALAMRLTDSGWMATIKLTPGKYWYKFIVDGNWMVDEDNGLVENDGFGNTNSIFYVTRIRYSP